MFKKTMAVIMTAALMLGLAACGSKGEVKEGLVNSRKKWH